MAATRFSELISVLNEDSEAIAEVRPAVVHELPKPTSTIADSLRLKLAEREPLARAITKLGAAVTEKERNAGIAEIIHLLKTKDADALKYVVKRVIGGLVTSNRPSFGLALAKLLEECKIPLHEVKDVLQSIPSEKRKIKWAKLYVYTAITANVDLLKTKEFEEFSMDMVSFLLTNFEKPAQNGIQELITKLLLILLENGSTSVISGITPVLHTKITDPSNYTPNLFSLALAIQSKKKSASNKIDLLGGPLLKQLGQHLAPLLGSQEPHHMWVSLIHYLFLGTEQNLMASLDTLWNCFVIPVMQAIPKKTAKRVVVLLIAESISQSFLKVDDEFIRSQILWQLNKYSLQQPVHGILGDTDFKSLLALCPGKIDVEKAIRQFLNISEVALTEESGEQTHKFREAAQFFLCKRIRSAAAGVPAEVPIAVEFFLKQALFVIPDDIPSSDVLHKNDVNELVVGQAFHHAIDLLFNPHAKLQLLVRLVKKVGSWKKEYNLRKPLEEQEGTGVSVIHSTEELFQAFKKAARLLPADTEQEDTKQNRRKPKPQQDAIAGIVRVFGCLYMALITLQDQELCNLVTDFVAYFNEQVADLPRGAPWPQPEVLVDVLLALQGYEFVNAGIFHHIHVPIQSSVLQLFEAVAVQIPPVALQNLLDGIEHPEDTLELDDSASDQSDEEEEAGEEEGSDEEAEETSAPAFPAEPVNPFLGEDDDENTPDLDDEQMRQLDKVMAQEVKKWHREAPKVDRLHRAVEQFQLRALKFLAVWVQQQQQKQQRGTEILPLVTPLLGVLRRAAHADARGRKKGKEAAKAQPSPATAVVKQTTAVLEALVRIPGTAAAENTDPALALLQDMERLNRTATAEQVRWQFSVAFWLLQFVPASPALQERLASFLTSVPMFGHLPLRQLILDRPESYVRQLVPAALLAVRSAHAEFKLGNLCQFLRTSLGVLAKLPTSSLKDVLCVALREHIRSAEPTTSGEQLEALYVVTDTFLALLPNPPAADRPALQAGMALLFNGLLAGTLHRWADVKRLAELLGIDRKTIPTKPRKEKKGKATADADSAAAGGKKKQKRKRSDGAEAGAVAGAKKEGGAKGSAAKQPQPAAKKQRHQAVEAAAAEAKPSAKKTKHDRKRLPSAAAESTPAAKKPKHKRPAA